MNLSNKLFFIFILSFITFLYFNFSNFSESPSTQVTVNPNAFLNQTFQAPDKTSSVSNNANEANSPSKTITQRTVPEKNTKADKIIKIAKSKLNKPYRRAGTTDKGYDCSGLVMTSFAKQNIKLPRASYEMAKKGIEVSIKNVKKGDLIFFGVDLNNPKKINHVGMVTSVKNKTIYFIHSSTKRGVIINTLSENYYKKRFVKVKRILK